jgi:sec-independent protein translocase protein TatA
LRGKEKIMFGLGWTELTIIMVIIMIIFGVGKLPEVGAGLGKGIREFKKATKEGEIEASEDDGDESKKA